MEDRKEKTLKKWVQFSAITFYILGSMFFAVCAYVAMDIHKYLMSGGHFNTEITFKTDRNANSNTKEKKGR